MVKVIILAAGMGSRLLPMTIHKPKTMVRVAGKPILQHQLDAYIEAGIQKKDIYVVTGYKAKKIDNFINQSYPGVNTVRNKKYLHTNNMYSFYYGLKKIDLSPGESLLISNADCVYEKSIVRDFHKSDLQNAIAVERGRYNDESMKILIDSQGNFINISKEISENQSNGVSIDLYKFTYATITKLTTIIKTYFKVNKSFNSWLECAFLDLFKQVNIKNFDIQDRIWVEIDDLNDLGIADRKFSQFRIKDKKCIICDLDGTVTLQGNPIEPAISFIKNNFHKYDFYFLTNNTSQTAEYYVKKLQLFDIRVTEDAIITPVFSLIQYINTKRFKSIYLCATNDVQNFIKAKCPHVSFEYNLLQNDAIILTYDIELTYDKIEKISYLLNNNKKISFIATHADLVCPTALGPIPDIGAIIQMLYITTGQSPEKFFGKPDPQVISYYVDKYGAESIVIVGDRIYTDKKLADSLGIDFICVLSGETNLIEIEKEEKSPVLIIDNLGELNA